MRKTHFMKRMASFGFALLVAASIVQPSVHASNETDFFQDAQETVVTENESAPSTVSDPAGRGSEETAKFIPESTEITESDDDTAGNDGISHYDGTETGDATFLSGTAFNVKIKQLSGDSSPSAFSKNNSIHSLQRADMSELPEGTKDLVSTNTSDMPIYSWYEDGVLYFASDADKLCLNAMSNFMFYGLQELNDVEIITEVDTSNAESMIEMFADCSSLSSLDLSSFDVSAAENMDKMFRHNSSLTEITLGQNWDFVSATSLPKTNWKSSKDGSVWTYAALETKYTGAAAATFTVTDEEPTIFPEEGLFEGDGLRENNMYPVGHADDRDSRFTVFCINDHNQDPYGYYRRIEILPDNIIGENWLQSTDFGSEPLGDTMREALITLSMEGQAALDHKTRSFTDIQKDIWHFTSHYSDKDWDGSFWEDKNFHKIDGHQTLKFYLYESLEGRQNVVSSEGIEIPQPVSVIISKVDEEGNNVKGAVLTLTGKLHIDTEGEDAGEIAPMEFKSEELKSKLVSLYPGTYTLSESKTPVGYSKAEDITFVISPEGTITCDHLINGVITMVDVKMDVPPAETDVSVSKQDIAGKEIAGARLTVKDTSNRVVASWISVEGKTHVIKNLPEGDYVLTESLAPVGYEKAESIDFTVDAKGKVYTNGKYVDSIVMVDDYIRGNVLISKQNIEGKEIGGAVMKITDSDGRAISSWTTIEGQSHEISNIPAGKYTLTEIAAPEGYEKAEDVQFALDNNGNVLVNDVKTKKVIMTDMYTGNRVSISKQDIEGKEIAGAKLKVTDKDGNIIDEWTSSEKKPHIIENVMPGDYILTETVSPAGYDKAEDISFTVEVGGAVVVAGEKVDQIIMVDKYAPYTVSIRKIEKSKSVESMLPGARLTILGTDKEAVYSWTSGEEARLVSLDPGKYTLIETEAPDGYLMADQIEFTVNSDGTVTLGTEKKPLGKPVITMVDEASSSEKTVKIQKNGMDGKILPGAQLKVTHKDGGREYIDSQWTSNGKVKELELIPGKYTLCEISAPDGYLMADDIDFTVNTDGSILSNGSIVKKIVMTDKPTVVDFKKLDSDSSDWVSGAKLQVLDKKGSVVEEWTSGDHVHTVAGRLKAGTVYTLHEDEAPEGYETAKDISFTVNKDETTLTITMKDTPKEVIPVEYGTLQIIKTVTGDGADLQKKFGFVISVMNKDNSPYTGNLPYVMSTGDAGALPFNSNGKAGFQLSHGQNILFSKLPAGTFYTVTELDYTKEGYVAEVRDGTAETKKGENIVSYTNTFGRTISAGGSSTTDGRTVTGTITSRDTGDSSNILVWSIILIAALVCTGFLLFHKKRNIRSK